MREDHDLGIDPFVAEAMCLSPNVTLTQALSLLKSCLSLAAIVVLSVGPAGFGPLLPRSTSNVLRLNTFDFLPFHRQN